MLDWLVIGDSVHGTYLSRVLIREGGVSRERVRVLDPHATPLARWDTCAENVGMAFLRSSFVHHIGDEPYELRAFAKKQRGFGKKLFLGRYMRPSLPLFKAHVDSVIAAHNLASMRIQSEALAIVARPNGMRVETPEGSIDARRVLLAIGAGDQPEIPDFARDIRTAGGRVHHVFERDFIRDRMNPFRHAVVIGGGISAAQTALALAKRAPGAITLLSRHALRTRTFDTDPGWMGPKKLSAFANVADHDERRRIVRAARYRGSMPEDVAAELHRALAAGLIISRIAGVTSVEVEKSEARLSLDDGKEPLSTDCVVLATGFAQKRPGGEWLERVVQDLGLRCASCGYPIVDASLRWHPSIFVTGSLAELELGPPARNILGARMAAERLLPLVR